jgi:phospholipase/carboxylesterase
MNDEDLEPLWLELPPISTAAPPRLMVFLHDAGSSAETFAPVAIAWQLKFPGATAALLQGPRRWTGGNDWYDATDRDAHGPRQLEAAAERAAASIQTLARQAGLDGARTVLVGVGQGASLALELARRRNELASIVVAYAARLARPLREGDRIAATVHLITGEFDSIVPTVHALQAMRGLRAVGAEVTLDIVEDESHSIGQGMVNLGTTRVMQTVFRGRRPRHLPQLH